MTALDLIYDKLKAGESFGKIEPHRQGGTYFWQVLSADEKFIHWNHYGSSANTTCLTSLYWIITTIFKTTPIDFLYEYTTYSEWNRINECYKDMHVE